MVLQRVVLGAGAEDQPWRAVAVQAGRRAGHGHRVRCGRRRAQRAGGEGQGLADAVGAVDVEKPGPVAVPVAQRGAGLMAVESGMGVVQVERLREGAGLHMRFELAWHAGHEVNHGADRVARIGGGERAVHHIDALDFLGRYQAPARRKGRAVAQVVGQQDAIRVDRRTGAVAGARCAARQHRVVVVADVALAHQQAGKVFQRVLAVGRIDRLFDLPAGDAFHGGGYLRGQRGRPAAGHGDGAEFTNRGSGGLLSEGASRQGRQQRRGDGLELWVHEYSGFLDRPGQAATQEAGRRHGGSSLKGSGNRRRCARMRIGPDRQRFG